MFRTRLLWSKGISVLSTLWVKCLLHYALLVLVYPNHLHFTVDQDQQFLLRSVECPSFQTETVINVISQVLGSSSSNRFKTTIKYKYWSFSPLRRALDYRTKTNDGVSAKALLAAELLNHKPGTRNRSVLDWTITIASTRGDAIIN